MFKNMMAGAKVMESIVYTYLPIFLPSLLIQEVTDLEWWLGGSGPTNKPVMTMGAVAHAVYYWLVEQWPDERHNIPIRSYKWFCSDLQQDGRLVTPLHFVHLDKQFGRVPA